MFVLSISLRIPEPYLLFENPRPLSPWGLPDFLSTCLGIDSLTIWPHTPQVQINSLVVILKLTPGGQKGRDKLTE